MFSKIKSMIKTQNKTGNIIKSQGTWNDAVIRIVNYDNSEIKTNISEINIKS